MLKLAALLLAAFGAAGLSDVADDPQIVQGINTFLNFVSVAMLVRASRSYRNEVAPAVARVETAVDEVLQPRPDGRRHYDGNGHG